MRRVAIVGGGITGLSTAYYLSRAGIDFILYESSARLGGLLKSEVVDGFLVEHGPDAFLTAKPWAAELAHELGIADQLLPSNDARRKTYIVVNGRLVPMPPGLQLMVPTNLTSVAFSPLFSFGTKLRMAKERFFPPPPLPDDKDESVADFTRRHFSQETVDRLADPLLAGVYGGDSSRLSARAVLPSLVGLGAKYRSLGRGLLQTPRSSEAKSLFTSFRGGMQQLADTLVSRIPASQLRLQCAVDALAKKTAGWSVRATGTESTFTDLVLALPSYRSSQLVWNFAPDLAALLNQIRYTSSITISLIDVPQPLPPGFGVLVPKSEKRHLIACTFVHNKFNGRSPSGKQSVRAFLTSGLERSDAELTELVRSDLSQILSTPISFSASRVQRWPDAMPQYEVGHLDRVAAIERAVAQHPGLMVIGNAFRGIGIPDCVRDAKAAAERIASSD